MRVIVVSKEPEPVLNLLRTKIAGSDPVAVVRVDDISSAIDEPNALILLELGLPAAGIIAAKKLRGAGIDNGIVLVGATNVGPLPRVVGLPIPCGIDELVAAFEKVGAPISGAPPAEPETDPEDLEAVEASEDADDTDEPAAETPIEDSDEAVVATDVSGDEDEDDSDDGEAGSNVVEAAEEEYGDDVELLIDLTQPASNGSGTETLGRGLEVPSWVSPAPTLPPPAPVYGGGYAGTPGGTGLVTRLRTALGGRRLHEQEEVPEAQPVTRHSILTDGILPALAACRELEDVMHTFPALKDPSGCAEMVVAELEQSIGYERIAVSLRNDAGGFQVLAGRGLSAVQWSIRVDAHHPLLDHLQGENRGLYLTPTYEAPSLTSGLPVGASNTLLAVAIRTDQTEAVVLIGQEGDGSTEDLDELIRIADESAPLLALAAAFARVLGQTLESRYGASDQWLRG